MCLKLQQIPRQILEALQRCFDREAAVYRSSKPSKEQVREWLRQETTQHRPPPDPNEIRRQLDWFLTEREYKERH